MSDDAPELWMDEYSDQLLTPDAWLEAQLAEASRRRGIRFSLRNAWLRLRGKPYYVGRRELALGAILLHRSCTGWPQGEQ